MAHRKRLTARPCSLLPWDHVAGRCARCGKHLEGRQRRWCSPECIRAYQENHLWQYARPACLRRDHNRCRRCGAGWQAGLEVNHKIPRNGQGYGVGCHHHQDNLETLCHHHHVVVTRHQRVARQRTRTRRAEEARLRATGD